VREGAARVAGETGTAFRVEGFDDSGTKPFGSQLLTNWTARLPR